MITKETASRIWQIYREIDTGAKLLDDLAEAEKKERHDDEYAPKLQDAFGCRRNFQLGVPSGENNQRLFMVSPKLAVSVIKAHIANKKAELIEANTQAKIEIEIAI